MPSCYRPLLFVTLSPPAVCVHKAKALRLDVHRKTVELKEAQSAPLVSITQILFLKRAEQSGGRISCSVELVCGAWLGWQRIQTRFIVALDFILYSFI